MGFRKVVIGARVFAADDDEKLLLTKAEHTKAQGRYQKELAKKLAREQMEE